MRMVIHRGDNRTMRRYYGNVESIRKPVIVIASPPRRIRSPRRRGSNLDRRIATKCSRFADAAAGAVLRSARNDGRRFSGRLLVDGFRALLLAATLLGVTSCDSRIIGPFNDSIHFD